MASVGKDAAAVKQCNLKGSGMLTGDKVVCAECLSVLAIRQVGGGAVLVEPCPACLRGAMSKGMHAGSRACSAAQDAIARALCGGARVSRDDSRRGLE